MLVAPRRALPAALLCAALAAVPAAVAAQDAAATRVPTVTRLVKLFSEQEAALATALQGGNAAAAERMLEDDFELRAGRMPGNPTPRAQWLRQLLGKPAALGPAEQMAVHDYGDIAVVSFLQKGVAKNQPNSDADLFTVDVWKRSGDAWRLAVRYASPAGGAGFAVPGASIEPPIPKKY